MKIDANSYKLTSENYIPQGTVKTRIVIGSTYSSKMRHYTGWLKRANGKYSRTAMFTVSTSGKIYQHFSPNFFSDFMVDPDLNEGTISIVLENEGWLIKDLTSENKYINYVGHIYNRRGSVIEKRWRNQNYWAPFPNKQIEATTELVSELCAEFNIPHEAIEHNTNFDGAHDFNGVLYRSNFEKHYTDISPAWDCKKFRNKVIKKQIK